MERRAAKAAANRTREQQSGGTRQRPRRSPPAPHEPARKRATQRCSTFTAFEAALEAFERKLDDQAVRFSVKDDVPLPPAHDPIGTALATSETTWRRQIRRALLVWHPDKWQKLLARADDARMLEQLTMRMTRAVLREKERGYVPTSTS